MAIGTAAAIGLGVAGIGSVLGASSSDKAASKAADTSLAVAQSNNALARESRDMIFNRMDPWSRRGHMAGNAFAELLGFEGGPEPAALPQGNAFSGFFPQLTGGFSSDVFPSFNDNGNTYGFNGVGGNGFGFGYQAQSQPQQQTFAPQQDAKSAFDRYQDSTGYKFRVSQGHDALNSGYAGKGALRSGAARKSFSDYNQNMASNEFGNYLGQLQSLMGQGLSADNALAGVSTNYTNQVSANNNNAGSAAANAALVRGQNNPFASLLGTIGGGVLGSSF